MVVVVVLLHDGVFNKCTDIIISPIHSIGYTALPKTPHNHFW
jgi:hypothetical protein